MSNYECAPFIYMRTAVADFRPYFLVRPQIVNDKEAFMLASKGAVQASFYYREALSDDDYRELIFPFKDFVVRGITTPMSGLCRKCGEEPIFNTTEERDIRRIVAFIGFMFRRNDINAPHIEFCDYLNLIKEYVPQRWNESNEPKNLDTATLVPFATRYFNEIVNVITPSFSCKIGRAHSTYAVHTYMNASSDLADFVWNELFTGCGVSFCSNIPDKTFMQFYKFSLITSDKDTVVSEVNAIRNYNLSSVQEETVSSKTSFNTSQERVVSPHTSKLDLLQEKQEEVSPVKKSQNYKNASYKSKANYSRRWSDYKGMNCPIKKICLPRFVIRCVFNRFRELFRKPEKEKSKSIKTPKPIVRANERSQSHSESSKRQTQNVSTSHRTSVTDVANSYQQQQQKRNWSQDFFDTSSKAVKDVAQEQKYQSEDKFEI